MDSEGFRVNLASHGIRKIRVRVAVILVTCTDPGPPWHFKASLIMVTSPSPPRRRGPPVAAGGFGARRPGHPGRDGPGHHGIAGSLARFGGSRCGSASHGATVTDSGLVTRVYLDLSASDRRTQAW